MGKHALLLSFLIALNDLKFCGGVTPNLRFYIYALTSEFLGRIRPQKLASSAYFSKAPLDFPPFLNIDFM